MLGLVISNSKSNIGGLVRPMELLFSMKRVLFPVGIIWQTVQRGSIDTIVNIVVMNGICSGLILIFTVIIAFKLHQFKRERSTLKDNNSNCVPGNKEIKISLIIIIIIIIIRVYSFLMFLQVSCQHRMIEKKKRKSLD